MQPYRNVERLVFFSCEQCQKDGKVHVHDTYRFLTIRQPKNGNAEGLFEYFVEISGNLLHVSSYQGVKIIDTKRQ